MIPATSSSTLQTLISRVKRLHVTRQVISARPCLEEVEAAFESKVLPKLPAAVRRRVARRSAEEEAARLQSIKVLNDELKAVQAGTYIRLLFQLNLSGFVPYPIFYFYKHSWSSKALTWLALPGNHPPPPFQADRLQVSGH